MHKNPKFKVGDRVQILRGAFTDEVGTVESLHRSTRTGRIVYTVKVFKDSARVHMFSYDLKTAPAEGEQKREDKPKTNPIVTVMFRPEDIQEQQVFKTGEYVRLTSASIQWLKENDPTHLIKPEDYYKAFLVTSVCRKIHRGRFRIVYSLNHIYQLDFVQEDLIPSEAVHTYGVRSSYKAKREIKKDNLSRLSLIKSCWNRLCNLYLAEFCRRHEFRFDADMWVAGNPGTTVEVCDMFVSMEDIRYDVDNQIDPEWFQKWYWKSIEVNELTNGKEKYLNYPSYCKGAPDPYTEEKMNRLREAHKRLRKAEASLNAEIDTFINSKKLF